MHHASRAFTMTEFVAVAAVLLSLAVLLAIIFHEPRPPKDRGRQLRGIHQGLVMYAQGNNDYYPGLNAQGEPIAIRVEQRLKLLLDGDYFSPEYLVSPVERGREPWRSGPFTAEHNSYAMLQVPESGGRHAEWRDTMNTRAAILADRNTGTVDDPSSIHYRHAWRGHILWNDNHVGFEMSPLQETEYGGVRNEQDHIFRAEGDDDAYMIHSGN